MSKKILGAAGVLVFLISLSITSNLQEEAEQPAVNEKLEVPEEERQFDGLTAGVTSVISDNSFTPESDEKTSIEKNNVIWVTSAYYSNSGDETGPENEEAKPENEAMESASQEMETASETAEVKVLETTVEEEEITEAPVFKNRWNITLTEEEIDLLARIVWLESQGEPVEGQEAVVEVIFNRMTSDLYPNTLYEVLSQKNPVQFCSWKNRDRAKPTEKEYASIYEVLNGNTALLRNDTMYFSTYMLTSKLDVKIGGHSFCY